MAKEISLIGSNGIPEDALFSIRAGAVRRQAPISGNKPYKFPEIGIKQSPIKIDILQPIGTAYIVVKPGEQMYQAKFVGPHAAGMTAELEIRPSDGSDAADKEAEAAELAQTAADSKKYLEGHGILSFVQAVLQTVIKERPADPYAHIARHFMCGYDPMTESTMKMKTAQATAKAPPSPAKPTVEVPTPINAARAAETAHLEQTQAVPAQHASVPPTPAAAEAPAPAPVEERASPAQQQAPSTPAARSVPATPAAEAAPATPAAAAPQEEAPAAEAAEVEAAPATPAAAAPEEEAPATQATEAEAEAEVAPTTPAAAATEEEAPAAENNEVEATSATPAAAGGSEEEDKQDKLKMKLRATLSKADEDGRLESVATAKAKGKQASNEEDKQDKLKMKLRATLSRADEDGRLETVATAKAKRKQASNEEAPAEACVAEEAAVEGEAPTVAEVPAAGAEVEDNQERLRMKVRATFAKADEDGRLETVAAAKAKATQASNEEEGVQKLAEESAEGTVPEKLAAVAEATAGDDTADGNVPTTPAAAKEAIETLATESAEGNVAERLAAAEGEAEQAAE